MSEYQEQKKTKPSIEESIEKYLQSNKRDNAIRFVSFLRENKMAPQWGSTNSYNVSYKNRRVCIVKINESGFHIWVNTQYNEDFNHCFSEESDAVKSYLVASIIYCFGCGSCKPGIDIEILGRQIKGACFNPVIRMENPSEEKIILAQKLILLRKQAIKEGKAPKVTYISMKKR